MVSAHRLPVSEIILSQVTGEAHTLLRHNIDSLCLPYGTMNNSSLDQAICHPIHSSAP